jgi:alpha-L-rhamnosidase
VVFSGAVQNDDPRWFLGEPDGFDPEVDVVLAQPFFSCFVHEGLARHGRKDLILANLLRWADPAWAPNGTFPEVWHAVGETLDDQCHPWCSTPTFDLTTYVLGVSPVEPGFRQGRFEPYLGPLQRASGRIPTPHGWISLSLARDCSRVSIPNGVELLAGGDTLGPGDHEVAPEV